MVSATDRDIKTVMKTIVAIASVTIPGLALKSDEEQQQKYSLGDDDRQEKVLDAVIYSEIQEEGEDDISKLGFVTLAFGCDSLLQRKDFVGVIMSKRCNWLFDDHTCRERVQIFNNDEVLEQYAS